MRKKNENKTKKCSKLRNASTIRCFCFNLEMPCRARAWSRLSRLGHLWMNREPNIKKRLLVSIFAAIWSRVEGPRHCLWPLFAYFFTPSPSHSLMLLRIFRRNLHNSPINIEYLLIAAAKAREAVLTMRAHWHVAPCGNSIFLRFGRQLTIFVYFVSVVVAVRHCWLVLCCRRRHVHAFEKK